VINNREGEDLLSLRGGKKKGRKLLAEESLHKKERILFGDEEIP